MKKTIYNELKFKKHIKDLWKKATAQKMKKSLMENFFLCSEYLISYMPS